MSDIKQQSNGRFIPLYLIAGQFGAYYSNYKPKPEILDSLGNSYSLRIKKASEFGSAQATVQDDALYFSCKGQMSKQEFNDRASIPMVFDTVDSLIITLDEAQTIMNASSSKQEQKQA